MNVLGSGLTSGQQLAIGLGSAGITGGLGLFSNILSNVQNARENDRQRQFQREMMEKQMWYNSPIHQREMLEEAGYSPAAYLGGSKAQSVGGSTPNVMPMQPFQPQDYINNALNALFQRMSMKADIENTNADTARKEFDLGVEKDSVVDTLNRRNYEAQKALFDAQIADTQSQLLSKYGDKRTQELINNLIAQTKKLNEESATQNNLREWYDAYTSLLHGRNRREQMKLKGELNVLFQTAHELSTRSELQSAQKDYVQEQSEYQDMYNRNYSHFGYSIMESAMRQGFAQEEQIRNLSQKLYQEGRVAQKDNEWYVSNQLTGMASRLAGLAKDVKQIESLSVSDDYKRDMIDMMWQKFENDLTPDEYETLEKYYDENGLLTGSKTKKEIRK